MNSILEASYYYFSFFCHQIITRSPEYGEMPFPVCFRCVGLYLGIICGYNFIYFAGKSLFTDKKALILVLFIIPVLVDGVGNKLDLWNSSSGFRVMTGISMGFVFPQLLSLIKPNPTHTKYFSFFHPGLPLLLSLALAVMSYYLILNLNSFLIFYGLIIIVTSGNLAFLLDMYKNKPFFKCKKLKVETHEAY